MKNLRDQILRCAQDFNCVEDDIRCAHGNNFIAMTASLSFIVVHGLEEAGGK